MGRRPGRRLFFLLSPAPMFCFCFLGDFAPFPPPSFLHCSQRLTGSPSFSLLSFPHLPPPNLAERPLFFPASLHPYCILLFSSGLSGDAAVPEGGRWHRAQISVFLCSHVPVSSPLSASVFCSLHHTAFHSSSPHPPSQATIMAVCLLLPPSQGCWLCFFGHLHPGRSEEEPLHPLASLPFPQCSQL